jgi:hypothetical protein
LHKAGHSYEKIFTKMLTGYDTDEKAVNGLKDKIAHTFKVEKDKIRVYTKDYFTLGDAVKFDNFVINPPYLDGSAGNIPVAHKHIDTVLEHWTRKGKGIVITKRSPLISNNPESNSLVRKTIFEKENHGSKIKLLDSVFDAIVRTMYIVFDPNDDLELKIYGSNGKFEYACNKEKSKYIFNNNIIKEVVELVGTKNNNNKSLYEFRRVHGTIKNIKIPTVVLIDNGKSTIKQSTFYHNNYGTLGIGMRFQVGGNTKDVYRSHTQHSVLVKNNQSIKKDYTFCKAIGITIQDRINNAQSGLYQIRHPLNAWIHAYTRSSEQSSNSPQFKFCARIDTDDFYKKWPTGNPTIKQYFDYWNIPKSTQKVILQWYKKYV